MKLDTIGKNIRKFRLAKKLRQEDLAEKTDLTTNYIGMVERGEKIPSLETFIKILNALGVSSDMVLTDVLETGYTVKNSMLNEKLDEDRNRIYEVIDTLVKQSNPSFGQERLQSGAVCGIYADRKNDGPTDLRDCQKENSRCSH